MVRMLPDGSRRRKVSGLCRGRRVTSSLSNRSQRCTLRERGPGKTPPIYQSFDRGEMKFRFVTESEQGSGTEIAIAQPGVAF
jgi:hypothetical protein